MNYLSLKESLSAKSNDELEYISNDCKEAVHAYPENPKCSQYNLTAHLCDCELHSRVSSECAVFNSFTLRIERASTLSEIDALENAVIASTHDFKGNELAQIIKRLNQVSARLNREASV